MHVFRYRTVFTWLLKGIGFGFGFTTPFGWLVYLLWFWFYNSQVKTPLNNSRKNLKLKCKIFMASLSDIQTSLKEEIFFILLMIIDQL